MVTSKIADVSRQIETVEIHLQNLEDCSNHDIHLEMQSKCTVIASEEEDK